jgi:uncharacterized protein (DUF58 family)
MQGNFHSVFKGSGIEFDDVRAYQYGDDIRTIDWNVTAKGHGTFVKTFREEKEQTVFFILDLSGSQEIGTPGRQKIDIGKEICGVLALSAVKESSQVGLIGFTDERELYIKPSKGLKHAYQIITRLFGYQTISHRTDLNKALAFTLNLVKRRSVIILISDFIDNDYWKNLKALSKKHDLVIIHLFDNRESKLPSLGIIPLYDKETGKTHWINTSSRSFRQKLVNTFGSYQSELQTFCKKHQVNYLSINTRENYVPMLIRLFKLRNKTRVKSA